QTIAEVSKQLDLNPGLLHQWRTAVKTNGQLAFTTKSTTRPRAPPRFPSLPLALPKLPAWNSYPLSTWTPKDTLQVLDQGADMVGLARAAIGNPSWPNDAVDPNWEPTRPPYAPEHLCSAGLSEKMITYMRAWPDFVTD
ncbi:MAG: hypothetical protein GY930_23090, partial [bacterium]|nr:hypothetical protein [bacterium]